MELLSREQAHRERPIVNLYCTDKIATNSPRTTNRLPMFRRKSSARRDSVVESYAVTTVLQHFRKLDPVYIATLLRGSTYVSLRHRYLYFAVPKNACSALKYLVFHLENCPAMPAYEALPDFVRQADAFARRDDVIHIREHFPVASLTDLDNESQREVLESPEFLRFAVVRNPYTRLVSAWRSKVLVCDPGFEDVYKKLRGSLPGISNKSLISFEEFVEFIERFEDLDLCNPHWRRQTAQLLHPAISFNFIGTTEKIGEVLDRLQRHIGTDTPLQLSPSNASGSRKDPLFTADLADRVYSLYRRDFDAFGYERISWPQGASDSTVPEDVFHDEIVERNLVISSLYADLNRLRNGRGKSLLRRLSRELEKLLPRPSGP